MRPRLALVICHHLVKADEAIIEQRLRSKARKDHILTDPLKMYRSFAKEFESFG